MKNVIEPYKGLKPYDEESAEIFFGRDTERSVLIDKILANKLTMLFAATGVGKSSLLQAAVMPDLKRPTEENLDVAYYNDWVHTKKPLLQRLKKTVVEAVQAHRDVEIDFLLDDDSSLKEFLHDCAVFASNPLIIILDQFEEFFQYYQYTDQFKPFIVELSEILRERRNTSIKFLISMREDFALNLNAFKGHLPTMLFENYYRLEKLQLDEARKAIQKPVEDESWGFRYEGFKLTTQSFENLKNENIPGPILSSLRPLEKKEFINQDEFLNAVQKQIGKERAARHKEVIVKHVQKGLVDVLLADLTKQEREGQIGVQKTVISKNIPVYVEPPNIQIVCTQLWELERHNPQKVIRFQTYIQQGGAKGFIDAYFKHVINRFSPQKKRIASKAFDHLVTPRGTKMAYPVKDLSELLRVNEQDLEDVLKELAEARVLRSQEREDVTWYELYHDIFSGIIRDWNSSFKATLRMKQGVVWSIIAVVAGFLLFVAYDIMSNWTSYHFRVSEIETTNQIELYRGKLGTWDVTNARTRYEGETLYTKDQLIPDTSLSINSAESVRKYRNLEEELIRTLPGNDRISAYWNVGRIDLALRLGQDSIPKKDSDKARTVINLLTEFRSSRILEEILLPIFTNPAYDENIRELAIEASGRLGSSKAISLLLELVEAQGEDDDIRVKALEVLQDYWPLVVPQETLREFAPRLVPKWLRSSDSRVRAKALWVLQQVGVSAIPSEKIEELFNDRSWEVRYWTVETFGALGDPSVLPQILDRLGDEDSDVQTQAHQVLQQFDASEIPSEELLALLNNPSWEIRYWAVEALGTLGDASVVPSLLERLRDEDGDVRAKTREILQQFKASADLQKQLVAWLDDSSWEVRYMAVEALGTLGDASVVPHLLERLQDENVDVQTKAREVLQQFDVSVIPRETVITLLDNDSWEVRLWAVEALGSLGDASVVSHLIEQLKDSDSDVRAQAQKVLQQFKTTADLQTTLVAWLDDDSWEVRYWAVEALGSLGDASVVSHLLKRLKDSYSDVRSKALEVILQFNSLAIPHNDLIALLNDDSWEVRYWAIEALGNLGDASVVSHLLEGLKDEDSDVRAKTREVLQQFETSAISKETLVALLDDASWEARVWAAETLGRLGEPLAHEYVAKWLQDERSDVQVKALKIVQQFDTQQFAAEGIFQKKLIELFYDPSWEVRYEALSIAGDVKDPSLIQHVLKRLKDDDSDVQTRAQEVLQQFDALAIPRETLLSSLNHDSWEVRYWAVEALGDLGDPSILPNIFETLEDEDSDVQAKALEVLQGFNISAVPKKTLIALLNHESWEVRYWAVEALGSLKDPSLIKDVLKRLRDEDSDVQAKALEVLQQFNISTVPKETLIESLNHESWEVRSWAVEALGSLKDPSVIQDMLRLFSDKDSDVRAETREAIQQFEFLDTLPEILLTSLNHASWEVRYGAVEALGMFGDVSVVPQMLERLEDNVWEVQYAAAETLRRFGSAAMMEQCFDWLNNESSDIRKKAAEILGHLESPEAIIPLQQLLTDEHWEVRYRAAEALIRLGAPLAVEMLTGLATDPNWEVRYQAAELLGQVDTPEAVGLLQQLLTDADVDVRNKATEVLVKKGELPALTTLAEWVTHGNWEIRQQAAKLLGQSDQPEAMELLRSLLSDRDEDVRYSASQALVQLKDFVTIEMLEEFVAHEDWEIRQRAAELLGQSDMPEAVALLRPLLEDEDMDVKYSANEALTQLKDSVTIGILEEFVAHEDWEIRQRAAELLGQSDEPEAMALLRLLLEDVNVDVRNSAVESLARLRDPAAIEILAEWMIDEAWEVRARAAELLGQLDTPEAVELLRPLLEDVDVDVRNSASQALLQLSDFVTIEILKEFARHEASEIRQNAAELLGQSDTPEAVDLLRPLLTDVDVDVRNSAVESLVRLRDPAVVEILADWARHADWEIRQKAAELLGQLSGEASLDLLLPLLTDEDRDVQHAALLGLRNLSEGTDGLGLIRKLSESEDVSKRIAACEILQEISSEQGQNILLHLLNDEVVEVQLKALSALEPTLSQFALPELHEMAKHPTPAVRKAALQVLTASPSPESLEVFKKIALDQEERIILRVAAIDALGEIETEKAVDALLMLLSPADEHFHYKVVSTLGTMPRNLTKSDISSIETLLENKHTRKAKWRETRNTLQEMLRDQKLSDEEETQLRETLKTYKPQPHMEFLLAYSIATIAPEDKGVKLLSDDLAKVRQGAWKSLANLALTDTEPVALQDSSQAAALIDRLAQERESSKDPFFSYAAYRAIDEMLITIETYGSTSALEALQRLQNKLQDEPDIESKEAILTRIQWTIERLAEQQKS